MFKTKLNKTLKKSLDNTINENKYLRKLLINQLEDTIMTINEIQDIQAINISEEEKNEMRNVIINKKRTEYVTKIIELDKTGKSSNSRI